LLDYQKLIEILEASEEGLELDTIFAKLLLTEEQHERKAGTPETMTALVAHGSRQKKANFRKVAGQGQHGPRKMIECWYCSKKGHIQAECRKRLRDEKCSFAAASTSTYVRMASAGLAKTTHKCYKGLLDSETTSHMTWNSAAMKNYQVIP
jgi:hypothetical protein